jgi:hypothetical protein
MPKQTLEEEVGALSAKVTALTMLVEALYVDDLAQDDNAAVIGEQIIASLLDTEKRTREAVGHTAYSLQISEAISSLIDRAVARAVAQRSKKRRK